MAGGLADMLDHPEELIPLVEMALAAKLGKRKLPRDDTNLRFCYDMLAEVSRSFAVVIQQLPNKPTRLRDAVCAFYLVLRALDTVEDDMSLSVETKLPILKNFHQHIQDTFSCRPTLLFEGHRAWTFKCGTGPYVRLMEEFPKVTTVFLGLNQAFREVITDITKRMGEGMAEFISKEVDTVADYDKYCHYVAGLVGLGLSKLFSVSELERPAIAEQDALSNHMGLFLQKTNIIRDYLEDINEEPAPRMFWPKEIWGRYADSLADFKDPRKAEAATQCLNAMVTDALQHLPFCLQYLELLRHKKVFRFCAIPQVMAMGTLALCYNNYEVFTGVVKMRRGQTARVWREVSTHGDAYAAFQQWVDELAKKVTSDAVKGDPSLPETKAAVLKAQEVCVDGLRRCPQRGDGGSQLLLIVVIIIVFFAILRLKRFLIDLNPQEGLGPG